MEDIQKRFIKMLCDAKGETYEQKLEDVGLTTLEERRSRGDMIQMFKTMSGLSRVDRNQWFQVVEEENRPLRANTEIHNGVMTRKKNIALKRYKTDTRGNSFTVTVTKKGNTLPASIQNAGSLNAFKNAFDKI